MTESANSITGPVFGLSARQFNGVSMEAYINGLPVLAPMLNEAQVASQLINDRVVPGENILELRIMRMQGDVEQPLVLTLYRNHPEAPDDEKRVFVMHQLSFPGDLDGGRVPAVIERRFEVEASHHRHACFSAEPTDFGPEGTPELHQAVRTLHDALTQRNVALLLQHKRVAIVEMAACFAGHPGFGIKGLERDTAQFLAGPVQVAPLDIDALHFQPLLDGRVAYVRRVDGADFIKAARVDDPERTITINKLLFAHLDNHWARI